MKYFKNPIFIENKINEKNIFIKKYKKIFCLSMFPYPSGKLHLGHMRNYILTDIISRYYYNKKKNVFQPIAWDSFGLPAENASIKYNISPKKWTISNIKYMRKQIKFFNIKYNWLNEFSTCQFIFYKWEFWILIMLFKNNLIIKKKNNIYWDIKDNCILSNEQVKNNIGWRSNSIVKIKTIKTWFILMKKYCKRLFKELKYNNWIKKIINTQKKWINNKILILLKSKNIFFQNLKYLNLKKINKLKILKKIFLLLIKNKNKKIFKLKIFFIINNKKKKIFFSNFFFFYKNKKGKLNLKILKKKIYILNLTNIKNWAIERNRNWGSPIFFKKCLNKNKKNKCKTIDTFFQSSWYYLFFFKSLNIFNIKKNNWFPINYYVGGNEHNNLHLLYLRLLNKFFYDLNIIKYKEIVKNIINQGFINNIVYLKILNKKKIFTKDKIYYFGLEKMSKSKKNGINPMKLIKKWGSDLIRLYLISKNSIYKNINWDNNDLNYLKKIIIEINNNLKNLFYKKVYFLNNIFNNKKIHKIISKITKILKKNNSNYQTKIIINYLFPIMPNISKILLFKLNNFKIKKYNIIIKKKYIFYYKKKFLRKSKIKLFYIKNKILKKIIYSKKNNIIILI